MKAALRAVVGLVLGAFGALLYGCAVIGSVLLEPVPLALFIAWVLWG